MTTFSRPCVNYVVQLAAADALMREVARLSCPRDGGCTPPLCGHCGACRDHCSCGPDGV